MTILKRRNTEACIILHTFSFLRLREMKVYPKNMLNLNSSSAKIGNIVTGDLVSDSCVVCRSNVYVMHEIKTGTSASNKSKMTGFPFQHQ